MGRIATTPKGVANNQHISCTNRTLLKMLKFLTFAALVAVSSAYLSHGPTALAHPGIYGNYGHGIRAQPQIVPSVYPYAQHPRPVIDPWPSVNQAAVHVNNLNPHSYLHGLNSGYIHSSPAPPAPTPTYLPPPVVSPATITYNNDNVIPPTIHNVNHGVRPNTINYAAHGLNYAPHGQNYVPQGINYASHGLNYVPHGLNYAPHGLNYQHHAIAPLVGRQHSYQTHENYSW